MGLDSMLVRNVLNVLDYSGSHIVQTLENILYYLMAEKVKDKDPVYLRMSRLAEGAFLLQVKNLSKFRQCRRGGW